MKNNKTPVDSDESRPHRSRRSNVNYRELDDEDEEAFESYEDDEQNGHAPASLPNRKRKRNLHTRRKSREEEEEEEEYHDEDDFEEEEEEEVVVTRRPSRSASTRSRRTSSKLDDYDDDTDDPLSNPRRSTRERKKKNFGDDFAYNDVDIREQMKHVGGNRNLPRRNATSAQSSGYSTRSHDRQRPSQSVEDDLEQTMYSSRPSRRAKADRVHYEELEEEEIEEENPRARKRARITRTIAQTNNETEETTKVVITVVAPAPPVENQPTQEQNENQMNDDEQQIEKPAQEEQEVPQKEKPAENEENQVNEQLQELNQELDQDKEASEVTENQSVEISATLRHIRHRKQGQRKDEEDDDYIQSANDEEEEEEEEIEDDDIVDIDDDDDEERRIPRTRRPRRRPLRRKPAGPPSRYNLRGKRHDTDSDDFQSSMSEGDAQPIKKRLRPRTDIQLQPFTAPPRPPSPSTFRNQDRAGRSGAVRNQLVQQLQNMLPNAIRPPSRRMSDSSSSSSSSSDSDSDGAIASVRAAGRAPSSSRYANVAPMNSPALDRKKKKKDTNADIDPIVNDINISWDSIGGLAHHVEALKEMVLLPLLYPAYFEKFQIAPPRGVIFYGPPGTGKTLVARALAGQCTSSGQPIAFFMRKGADILSKWVGEAEKQLRLLFERAKELQPSIIFFDEIDGLAPVRSSKQDYIHSSIVSTLLALMDGLDNRGQVVVIGATNRIDAIDPALRRPGRFDRELAFTLPNMEARKEIFRIHTKNWKPKPEGELVESICRLCVGYCGADIKALVTEAALHALKRKFPQIYSSTTKLNIDLDTVQITRMDFLHTMKQITPAAHRNAIVHSQPLPSHLSPVLTAHLEELKRLIKKLFPASSNHLDPDTNAKRSSHFGDMSDDHNVNLLSSMSDYYLNPPAYRPWIMITGSRGMGQQYLGQALLYALEAFPVYSLGLASLFSNVNFRGVEETLVSTLAEARKHAPSIVFIPEIDEWWKKGSELMRSTLLTMLRNLRSSLPVLVLATANSNRFTDDDADDGIPYQVCELFREHVYHATPPTMEQIATMFEVVKNDIKRPPLKLVMRKETETETVPAESAATEQIINPVAPAPVVDIEHEKQERQKRREQMVRAEKATRKHEKHTLMEMRLHLRDIMIKITNQNIYQVFAARRNDSPVNINGLLYLCDIAKRLENGYYTSLKLFLQDIKSISANAELYVHGGAMGGATPVTNAFEGDSTSNTITSVNLTNKEVEKRMNVVMRGRQLYEAVQTVAAQLISNDLVSRCNTITKRRRRYEAKKKIREEDDTKFIEEISKANQPEEPPPQQKEDEQVQEKAEQKDGEAQEKPQEEGEQKEVEEEKPQEGEQKDGEEQEKPQEEGEQKNALESLDVMQVDTQEEPKNVDNQEQNNDKQMTEDLNNSVVTTAEPVHDAVVNDAEDLEVVDTCLVVEIDYDRLDRWSANLIIKTEQCSVDELDKWFSNIYQHIFQYRFNAQRDDLLAELESLLER
jgi:SpoVK/Ycf46/Vps4 family AAA+-type ATPase